MGGIETGVLRGAAPFVRIRGGSRVLVFLAGLENAFVNVRAVAWPMAAYFRPYLKTHTVYALGRRKGFPEGYSLDDMVQECRAALDDILDRESLGAEGIDVMGISLGGILALNLAARDAHGIRRLAVVSSTWPLPPATERIIDRSRDLMADDRWFRLLLELTGQIFLPPLRWLVNSIIGLYAPVLALTRRGFDDAFRARDLLEAAHSGAECFSPAQLPTLLLSGTADCYFPPGSVQALAARIEGCEAEFVQGGSHAMAIERRGQVQRRIIGFLSSV